VQQAKLKKAQDEEKMKNLTPKEREEFKKIGQRLTGENYSRLSKSKFFIYHTIGRTLFEQNRQLATSDAAMVEEGAVSVDLSQYDRTAALEDEEVQEEGIHFSDSD